MPAVRAYVCQSGRLIPLDGGTPIIPPPTDPPPPPPPPPPPRGKGMLVGAARHDEPSFLAEQAQAGPWTVARTYQSGGWKATWSADVCAGDVGLRASVYSCKPDMQALLAGTLDVSLTAFIQSIPNSHVAFIECYHELDVKTRQNTYPYTVMTPAQVAAAKLHFYTLVKAVGKPHVYTTLILSEFSVTSGISKGLPSEFWVGPDGDDRVIDVVGWDGYQDSNGQAFGSGKWGACLAFARLHGAGWGIAEVGLASGVTSMSAGATWMQGAADYAFQNGSGPHSSAAYFCQFNSTAGGVLATPGAVPELIAQSLLFSAEYLSPYTSFVL